MTPGTSIPVIAHLRRWLTRAQPNPASDAELLRRYALDREDAAFAALVERHGSMVFGVARRVVSDYHTAEDVFQATFVLLARQAAQLRQPAALPAWLHRTAHNLAITALRARERRARTEAETVNRPSRDPLEELSSRELLLILDEELHRLPETLRLPLILCCLEGRSQESAAGLLGWTVGSVKGRLERGRQRLRKQLARRGLTFAVGAGVPLLVLPQALAGTLRDATVRAALGGESLSPPVSALVKGAAKTSLAVCGKAFLVVLAVALTGIGVAVLSGSPEQAVIPAAQPAAAEGGQVADAMPEGAVAQLGTSPLRIGNSAFALTPDGRTIVTVAPEGIVRRFDAATGRLLERRQPTDRSDVDPTGQFQAQLSADGRIAVTREGSAGRARITVWDVSSGKVIFRRVGTATVGLGASSLSPDGRQLAIDEGTRGPDGTQTLWVYDLKTGQKKELGSLEYNVHDIRFLGDGKRVIVSQVSAENGEATFACFDVPAGRQLWKVPRKGDQFAVSLDGKTLVSAEGYGFRVIAIDPDSDRPSESFKPWRPAHPNVRLVIAPDNRTVIMRHFDGIRTWDLRTGQEVARIPRPKDEGRGYGPELGAVSADGKTVITNLGALQRWDLTTGKPLFDAAPEGFVGPIERLAFSIDGKQLFASSWSLQSILWDVATGKPLARHPQRFGHQVVSTPDGLRSVSVNSYQGAHEVTIFDPVAGKPLWPIRWANPEEVGPNGLRAYALTQNGKTLLVAHGEEPGRAAKSSVTVCDVASGRRRARFSVPGDGYYSRLPFSLCGRWLVVKGTVYHAGTGTELFAPASEESERLHPSNRWEEGPIWFSDDGRLLAGRLSGKGEQTKATDALAVWELATGKILTRFAKEPFVAQLAFAPDGRTVALLDAQGVRLHDLLTGKRLATYQAPDVTCVPTDRGSFTQTVVFAPDGRTLATGHTDGSVVLWKAPLSEEGAKALMEAESTSLWAELGSDSPVRARLAVDRLARHPVEAVALLTGRFRPAPAPVDPALAALMKDLDSDDFATREDATRKLRDYGAKAEPALRQTLAAGPSLDMRRRIDAILLALSPPPLRLPVSGETLRGSRAIEVLERIRTVEARKLLQAWADQTQDLWLSAEARATLERVAAAQPGS